MGGMGREEGEGGSRWCMNTFCTRWLFCLLFIQGVRSIKATDLKAVYVHIKPPSLEVLEERLRARKTDTDEVLRKRLAMAKIELEYGILMIMHVRV